MKEQIPHLFQQKYGKIHSASYFAPGRVNLIGEHIDYNGGLVLPCTITLGTWLFLAPNNDNVIRFASTNFDEYVEIPINNVYEKTNKMWFNYPLGVINELQKRDWQCPGLDLLFYGNIPIGSGLSSSASIEVLTAFGLNHHFDLGLDKLAMVKLAKNVENEFIGLNSGIMDQFAVTFGEPGKAILLNCDTLKHKMIACDFEDYSLAIINTNKHRRLEDSKYNERVEECKRAVNDLREEINIAHLCDLNAEKFALHSHLIKDETVFKRASHVVKENDRVHVAAKALSERNLIEFGRLMYASHQSLRTWYQVSGVELDTIVDFCKTYRYVLGARMTGAGFGGCAIALLKKGFEEDFAKHLSNYYFDRLGYHATIYIQEIGAGPTALNN